MKNEEPRFKLKIYKEDILQLIYNGYTYAQILKYLKIFKKVEVSESTLKRNIAHFKKEEKNKSTRVESQNKYENTLNKTNSNSKDRMSPEEFKKKLEGN